MRDVVFVFRLVWVWSLRLVSGKKLDPGSSAEGGVLVIILNIY
jgi:hypothetical protein